TAEGTLHVADTGSTNGTYINGRRISYGESRLLEDGDVVGFGVVEVRLRKSEYRDWMNLVTILLLLFQTPTPSPLPTPHVLERTPALLTLIYVGGLGFIILLLLLGLVRSRRQTASPIPEDLPKAVRKRLGSTSTNRGLKALRWLFVLLSIGLFSFHIYWAHYAAERNEKFQELSYKDLRGRRLSESTLRGWIFD